MKTLLLMWPLYTCSRVYTCRSLTVTRTRSDIRAFCCVLHVEGKHGTSVSFCYLSHIDIFQYVTQCSRCTRENTLCFMPRTYTSVEEVHIWIKVNLLLLFTYGSRRRAMLSFWQLWLNIIVTFSFSDWVYQPRKTKRPRGFCDIQHNRLWEKYTDQYPRPPPTSLNMQPQRPCYRPIAPAATAHVMTSHGQILQNIAHQRPHGVTACHVTDPQRIAQATESVPMYGVSTATCSTRPDTVTILPNGIACKYIFWLVGWLVGWLVVLRIYVALAVFQPYRDLEAGDNQSLKFKWRGRKSNSGPLAPQAKSLTTRPPPLPKYIIYDSISAPLHFGTLDDQLIWLRPKFISVRIF